MSAYTLKQAQIKEWRKKKKTAWGFQKPLATVLQIARLKPNLLLLLNVQIFVIPLVSIEGDWVVWLQLAWAHMKQQLFYCGYKKNTVQDAKTLSGNRVEEGLNGVNR